MERMKRLERQLQAAEQRSMEKEDARRQAELHRETVVTVLQRPVGGLWGNGVFPRYFGAHKPKRLDQLSSILAEMREENDRKIAAKHGEEWLALASEAEEFLGGLTAGDVLSTPAIEMLNLHGETASSSMRQRQLGTGLARNEEAIMQEAPPLVPEQAGRVLMIHMIDGSVVKLPIEPKAWVYTELDFSERRAAALHMMRARMSADSPQEGGAPRARKRERMKEPSRRREKET
jgi:hypothetical protein